MGCKPDELQQVIRPFEHPDVCFLEQRPSKSANEVLVDVSHESLIRQWSTAKGWADAEAEKVRKFRELAYSAVSWERRKRSPDFLKRRGELEVINAWWSEEAPNENWTRRYTLTHEGGNLTEAFKDVKEYLRTSSETDRAEQAAAERERVKQVSERSRRQRNKIFVAAVVLLLFGAIAAGAFIWQTKQYDSYRVRVASLLAEEALRIFGPARALLAAMEGIDDVLPELPQMQRVGYRALAQLRERRILEDPASSPVQGVQFAPHQPVLITTTQNGWLRFWKLETGELIDSYLVGGRFLIARWSPDGTQLFVSARDVDGFFLIPCSREKLRPLFSQCASSTEDKKRSFNQKVGAGSFSPDGRWIVTGAFYATTKLWDVTSIEQPKKDFGHSGSWMAGAAFSHDSQRLAVAAPTGEIRVYRTADALKQTDENPEARLKPKSSVDQMSGMEASEFASARELLGVSSDRSERPAGNLPGRDGTIVGHRGKQRQIAVRAHDRIPRRIQSRRGVGRHRAR